MCIILEGNFEPDRPEVKKEEEERKKADDYYWLVQILGL